MNEEDKNRKAKTPGTPSESVLRQKIVPFADEIIEKLLEHMRSRNPNVSLGAANTLLKKIIPDIKALEITGENGEPIKLNIISGADYLSAVGKLIAPSTTSTVYGSTPVQNSDLASESTQNNNSDKSDSKVESA